MIRQREDGEFSSDYEFAGGRHAGEPSRPSVLVTGAMGAIGRAVVAEAIGRGARVTAVGLGCPPTVRSANVTWTVGAIEPDRLDTAIAALGPVDAVVHLAGGSMVGASIDDPQTDFDRTVVAAQHLLDWIRRRSPRTRVVLASSAAVYGANHDDPIGEDASTEPASPYGSHKLIVEELARSFGRNYGVASTAVRLFSVYGPEMRKQFVWDTVRRLLAGERRLVFSGTGSERRDFVFVRDAAAMLLDAAGLADPGVPVFNGGGSGGVTIADVAARIADHFGGAEIAFDGQVRRGDPRCLVADGSRARAVGLIARTPLEVGLVETIDWIRSVTTAETAA